MVGHFLDEGVGAVGDRNPAHGSRRDIDRVDADGAERDDPASLEPVDDLFCNPHALGVHRVGIASDRDEGVLVERSFDDLGLQALERLHLEVIAGAGRETRAGRRDDLELRHTILLVSIKTLPDSPGNVTGVLAGDGADWRIMQMPVKDVSVSFAPTRPTRANKPDGYVLGLYRIASAPEPNSSRPTSFKSTCFDSPANSVGPWPASLGCTTNSNSSINPSSANASGSFTPPTSRPLPDCRFSCSTALPS